MLGRDGQLVTDREGIIARWREHFSSMFEHQGPADPSVINDLPQHPYMRELDNPPTLDEVRGAVESMSNGKSPGIDGIPAEILKCGGSVIIEILHRLYVFCWERVELP